MNAMVEIQGVHKSFGGTHVLKGVDLTVEEGQVTCIIGPSGSGKSTLLRCVNHLETIDAGRIYVGGKIVGFKPVGNRFRHMREAEVAASRAEIGLVFQQFNLFPHLTALENVLLAPRRVQRRDVRKIKQEALALLEKVGLEGKRDRYPAQLSGGQQQRVAIARALAMRPKLMLFDEATSALDPELVGEVLNVMKALAHEGRTMMIVTHEIGFARDVADKLVFMDDGRIVEIGDPEPMIANPQHSRTQSFLARVK